jgi:hypothetical protein
VIRQPSHNAGTKNLVDRVLDYLTRFFIHDPKDDRKQHSFSLGLRPACEPLRLRVDKSHATFGIGDDDAISDAAERGRQEFRVRS